MVDSELLGTSVSSPLVLRRSSYVIIEEECNKGRADLCDMNGAQLLSATVGDLKTAELSWLARSGNTQGC